MVDDSLVHLFRRAQSSPVSVLWHTDVLLRGVRGGAWRLLLTKTVVLITALALLALPFWLFTAWLARSSAWDGALLLALLLAQIFTAGYAGAAGAYGLGFAKAAATRLAPAGFAVVVAVAVAGADHHAAVGGGNTALVFAL